jgi:hypothetical protein
MELLTLTLVPQNAALANKTNWLHCQRAPRPTQGWAVTSRWGAAGGSTQRHHTQRMHTMHNTGAPSVIHTPVTHGRRRDGGGVHQVEKGGSTPTCHAVTCAAHTPCDTPPQQAADACCRHTHDTSKVLGAAAFPGCLPPPPPPPPPRHSRGQVGPSRRGRAGGPPPQCRAAPAPSTWGAALPPLPVPGATSQVLTWAQP